MSVVVRGGLGARAARAIVISAVAGMTCVPAYAADPPPVASPAPTPHLAIAPALLASQPEPIARALRANVVIERDEGDDRPAAVGAGVILRLRDGTATIATARHVVDPRFTAAVRAPSKPDSLPAVTVTSIGSVRVPAKVEWLAPHGVDLAIVSAPLTDPEARAAARAGDAPLPQPGDRVFTVGNPQGGYWTRVDGTVKQQRATRQDGFEFTLLWSDLVAPPGFSGGGLYDAQGRLVAIDSTRGAISAGLQGRALLLSTTVRALERLAPAAAGGSPIGTEAARETDQRPR